MAKLQDVREALNKFLDVAAEKARQDARGGMINISDILDIRPDDDEVEVIDDTYINELRNVVREQMRTREGARRLFVAIGFAIRQVGKVA